MNLTRRSLLTKALVAPLVGVGTVEATGPPAALVPIAVSWTQQTIFLKETVTGFQCLLTEAVRSSGKVEHPNTPLSPVFPSKEEGLAWMREKYSGPHGGWDKWETIPLSR